MLKDIILNKDSFNYLERLENLLSFMGEEVYREDSSSNLKKEFNQERSDYFNGLGKKFGLNQEDYLNRLTNEGANK